MSFKLPSQIQLNSRVRHRRVNDDGVVVCMHTGNVLVVNAVGSHIVEQLNNHLSTDEIAESICVTFDVTKEAALTDLSEYVQQLIEQDVITVAAEDATL